MHIKIKPHHFLDLICDTAVTNGIFEYISPYGHGMREHGNLLSQGKINSLTFTCEADDICKPCIKLKEGHCTDLYNEELTARFGFDNKYDYNMKLDLGFINVLPEIFSPNIKRDIDDILSLLKEKLTPEIILLNWPRENRVDFTLHGLDMVINARKTKSEGEYNDKKQN